MRVTVAVVIATAFLTPATASAQEAREEWRQDQVEARQSATAGDKERAIALYDEATKEAPNEQVRAELLVELGNVSGRRRPVTEVEQTEILEQSADAFKAAMEIATGKVRLQAANNYASQLLRLDRAGEAVDVMRKLWSEFRNSALDPLASSRSLYTYARALEDNGYREEAVEFYSQSLRADPEFGAAKRALARMALDSDSESAGIPELLRLTMGLIERGECESALEYLRDGLLIDHWRYNSEYPRLAAQLVRALTEARTSPEEYEEEWREDLQPLPLPRLADVDSIYLESLPVTLDQYEVRDRFGPWDAQGEPELLSSFLKMVGDHHFRGKRLEMALGRYTSAWVLDTTNMEAGLYLVNLLSSNGDVVDPNGYLLDQFIDLAFSEKGEAYLGEDWASILKFHTILGTLFERQEIWGPAYQARTAAFQWSHALAAHARLVELGADVPNALPSVRVRLARAFEETDDQAETWKQRVLAAKEYMSLGRPAAALSMIETAQALNYIPKAEELTHLEVMHSEALQALEQVPDPQPPGPSGSGAGQGAGGAPGDAGSGSSESGEEGGGPGGDEGLRGPGEVQPCPDPPALEGGDLNEHGVWSAFVGVGSQCRSGFARGNLCSRPVTFKVRASGLQEMMRVDGYPGPYTVEPEDELSVGVLFDGRFAQPGVYEGKLKIRCTDCNRPPPCDVQRETVKIRLRVGEGGHGIHESAAARPEEQ